MTDNQDPQQALKTLIDNKENLSATASTTSGELTPEQQADQQLAKAEEEAKLQAQLEEHEKQQAVQDQQALESLRTELPQVVSTEPSEEKTQVGEAQNGETQVGKTQDLTQESTDEKAIQQLTHQVEQLKRLD
ncbi:MAG: hypothetical protein XD98_0013 [Microgenomates bacterium 39_6]|nr:MAG: hypothetical protein XD98_0013 [Microgenomates bacterium 39_6]